MQESRTNRNREAEAFYFLMTPEILYQPEAVSTTDGESDPGPLF